MAYLPLARLGFIHALTAKKINHTPIGTELQPLMRASKATRHFAAAEFFFESV
jgi:hypothetical protein